MRLGTSHRPPGKCARSPGRGRSGKLRHAVHQRSDVTGGSVDQLTHDRDPNERISLAANTRSPLTTVCVLASDAAPFVHSGPLANSEGPPDATFRALAADRVRTVRAAVASYEDASTALLQRLARDPDCGVRALARYTLNLQSPERGHHARLQAVWCVPFRHLRSTQDIPMTQHPGLERGRPRRIVTGSWTVTVAAPGDKTVRTGQVGLSACAPRALSWPFDLRILRVG